MCTTNLKKLETLKECSSMWQPKIWSFSTHSTIADSFYNDHKIRVMMVSPRKRCVLFKGMAQRLKDHVCNICRGLTPVLVSVVFIFPKALVDLFNVGCICCHHIGTRQKIRVIVGHKFSNQIIKTIYIQVKYLRVAIRKSRVLQIIWHLIYCAKLT